jgi:orotate phosphoribosyltransferase
MDLLDIIKKSGGYFKGHTEFRNAQHGDGWIEKGYLVKNPVYLDLFVKAQSDQIRRFFPKVDLLVGPVVNGSIIASHISKYLQKEFAVTYDLGNGVEFHRMNLPQKNLKTVIVEDFVFTGKDVKENIVFLENYGLEVLGVSTWINRLGQDINGVKISSLIDAPFENYSHESCKLCKADVQIEYFDVRE